MPRKSLGRRIKSLRNVELFNVFFLPYILVLLLRQTGVTTWILVSYSLFLVSFILAQGTLYWHLKGRSIQGSRDLPLFFRPLFLAFRRIDRTLFTTYPLLVIGVFFAGHTTIQEIIWATAFWIFALLEYINYYQYQLMHDTFNDLAYLRQHRKLRRARLAKDLEQSQKPV